jgi:hypothetical protein
VLAFFPIYFCKIFKGNLIFANGFRKCDALKGLSYEIDFENVDENWQILALTRAAAGFW